MLIKITNRCGMGCSHCFEESTPAGEHMVWDTFQRALDATRRIESLAYRAGCLPFVLISGGECTEHPDVVKYVEEVVRQKFLPLLITNGMWLGDPELRKALLRPEWPFLSVQVTNDARFYPTAPTHWDDSRITYVPALTTLVPLGRASRKDLTAKGVPSKNAPPSFNFRSLMRSFGSIERAVAELRLRAMVGKSGHCIPSISATGDIVAGETNLCWKIGTVDSSNEELARNAIAMGSCNRCGLESNLTEPQKRAIGVSAL